MRSVAADEVGVGVWSTRIGDRNVFRAVQVFAAPCAR
jgi:hypothetical protein